MGSRDIERRIFCDNGFKRSPSLGLPMESLRLAAKAPGDGDVACGVGINVSNWRGVAMSVVDQDDEDVYGDVFAGDGEEIVGAEGLCDVGDWDSEGVINGASSVA